MTTVKLSNVDLAWLRLDRPTNPMMISVVIQFDGRISYDEFVSSMTGIVTRYRRFRQRIVRPRGIFSRPYWEDDPGDRVEDHIERLQLTHPIDDISLDEIYNRKMNTPLDFTHPLWRISLVENHPEGSIMIVTIHHCIADGISLLQVLLQMTRAVPNQPAEVKDSGEPQTDLLSSETQTQPQASPVLSDAVTGQRTLIRRPNIADMIAAIVRIVFRPADPQTIFKGQLGTTKKIVWTEAISLTGLKKISTYNGSTINDVLMAITSGAIRHYLDLHHIVQRKDIRAFILVNLRGKHLNEDLGNNFGLVFLSLPIKRAEPLERLEAIKQGMDYLKASAEYAATYFILNVLGMMPAWVEDLAVKLLDTKGTIVATNVPGPRRQLCMAGAPIASIKAWVPQSGRIGIGLSFFSYNGKMGVGLNSDVGVIPDPEKLLQLFIEEYQSMLGLIQDSLGAS